jgi:hypothetical protein
MKQLFAYDIDENIKYKHPPATGENAAGDAAAETGSG